MKKPSTITVRGQRVSNRTNSRYVWVSVREREIVVDGTDIFYAHLPMGEVYHPFAEVMKRSDSVETLRKAIRSRMNKYGKGVGIAYVIVDTETGEEVQ